jgi:hypothetical protein
MQFMHEHATTRDFLFRTAQPDFWHRSLRPIDEIRIERLRQPPPDAGRFIDRSNAHRGLSHSRFVAPNVLSIAYEFEAERTASS